MSYKSDVENVEDCLMISVDISLGDDSVLLVGRRKNGELYIVNEFKNKEAVEMYNYLLGDYKGK